MAIGKAVLQPDDFREFNERVAILTEQGYDLPFTVELLKDGTFKVELHGEHDFEELDKLTNSGFAS